MANTQQREGGREAFHVCGAWAWFEMVREFRPRDPRKRRFFTSLGEGEGGVRPVRPRAAAVTAR